MMDLPMRNTNSLSKISVADYLDGELDAKQRHEYVDGVVYTMVCAKVRHNRTSINTMASIANRLLQSPCEAFNSDTKVRVQSEKGVRFYYPDGIVVCDSNSEDSVFQDKPVVIVEVISESTRRTDETEKRESYLSINSLQVYLRVEQSTPCVKVDRRTEDGFVSQQYEELTNIVPLPTLGIELPLSDLYRGVEFPGPVENDEE
jgi:Uma2 family endonuclease